MWGGGKCVYAATGNNWQGDGSPDTRWGPEVSMSLLPPSDHSTSFSPAKHDESATSLHLLAVQWE